jgi:PhzF family phenazine biosynthesis protein
LDLVGYYVFTTATENSERDATSRMFAPRYGIQEEAGTGMAAGPLACYLYDQLGIRKEHFLIQQGAFMNPASTSLIMVELTVKNGLITKVMAGGKGIPNAKMIVEL